jgi:hypothetical protein
MLIGETPFDARDSFFDLDIFPSDQRPVPHGDAVIGPSGDASLKVTTPQAMWSYAASLDLAAPIAQAKNTIGQVDDGFTIEVELRVSRGHIGVLVVGDDINTPIRQENMVAADVETATLMITVPAALGARHLIFRNTAASGRSSFEIKRIRLRFVAAGENRRDKPTGGANG